MKLRLLVVALLTAFAVNPVFGQEDREDRSALLPDIDPQDIEIRGDFRARFTGISRQPILGFSPTPRVFRIDPDRMPFMESPEEVVASLPLSELEPQLAPPRDFKEYPPESRIFGYAGFGNYTSPEASLFAGIPTGELSRLSMNLEHLSSEGHFDDEQSVNGAFRRFSGDASWRSRLTSTGTLTLGARGRSDFSDSVDHLWILQDNSFQNENKRINLDVIGGMASWRNRSSVHDTYGFRFDYAYTQTAAETNFTGVEHDMPFNHALSGIDHEAGEHRMSFSTDYAFAASRIGHVFSFELDAEAGLYEFSETSRWQNSGSNQNFAPLFSEFKENWYVGGIGAYWKRELSSGNRMKVGGRFFGGYDSGQEMTLAGFPYFLFELRSMGPLSLKTELSGYMKNQGLEQVYVQNRQTGLNRSLLNERTFYGDVQLQFEPGGGIALQTGLYASWTERPFMYYNRSYHITGFTSWMYPEDLLLIRPSAGITYNLSPRRLMIYAEAHANFTSMSEPLFPDTDLNTFSGIEAYRITGGLRTTPFEHAVFKVWADYIGPREELIFEERIDFTELVFGYTDEPGNALLLNIQAEYRLNGRIGFYIKALNLLNESYEIWDGYEERPLQLFGGVTFNF